MLLRHETTPGYAALVRQRRRRRSRWGRAASAVFALGLLATIVVAAMARPSTSTLLALGVVLLLYGLASFGLEQPPRSSTRTRPRSAGALQRHGRRPDSR